MTLFERRIKPVIQYVGAIGAALMSVSYIIIVFVLIWGFKVSLGPSQLVFAIVNAAVGFLILQFLKVQGISFAKSENAELVKRYYQRNKKPRKIRTTTFYWITSTVKDLCLKFATLAGATMGVLYIVVEGSNDYNLLLLAVANLIMFICFGLLSLNSAYDFYINNQVPFMMNKLKEEEETSNNGIA